MKKKIISLLSALALTAQIVPCALAGNDVKVYVNDTEMVTDAPIIIENNRTLAPVRAILEYLDYNVDWDGDAQKVVITKNNTEVELHIGDDTFFVDGILQSTDTAPQIINDLTYVPLAVIAQAFLCQVDWDGDKYEVHITPPYEYEKDKYVIISGEDLEKIQTEKDKTIQILKFVKEAEVDPIYFEKNYYAQPDKQGQKAFDLLREAMLATKKAAVARTVLGTKEALLLIRAVEDGMRVTSLYFEDEIVTAPAKTASKLTKAEVAMAKQLIDQLSGPFDIADYHDEYQERLRNLIERKIHGQEIVKVKEKQSVQAVDLMEALSQSLKQTTAGAAKARTTRKRTGKSLS